MTHKSMKAPEHEEYGSTVFACHLTRSCNVILYHKEVDEHFCDELSLNEHTSDKREFPLSCLNHHIMRHAATKLILGSVYNLLPHVIKSPPVQPLRFSSTVEMATLAIRAAFSESLLQSSRCAHLRVGFSYWDSKPAEQFMSHWQLTITSFDNWVATVPGSRVLVLTDNHLRVDADSQFCGSNSSVCVFENSLSPHLSGLKSQQKLAVLQRTCAHASDIFLTTASSFSEFIGALHVSMADNTARNLDALSKRSVTYSKPRQKDDIFG